ncbi:tRNA pseudouridine(38-40) synthase TruA [Desulfovibrio psychrotolerans]|uniref:tRNA pseudouridine synthase A n=1 Tax=Desulfovibrio psychrotolerans TaxID=415242 RepID=A0A7J0BTQ2_9BACT|nr:tRNA pseudouridine(38-40) synthase TruA [Desulfovibrio psychrotolerans]GFM37097.1 tRNA pseudouridine synthase A [Desulfovibrio psychrotolerans]
MPRLKLTIAYVGTNYCGWQIQAFSRRPQPTVQEELERVAERVLGTPVRIFGSGRTDSGVHAEGQVAHFDVPEDKADRDWQRTFNAMLPDDIAVLDVERVASDFHARINATGKIYAYSLWLTRRYTPPRLFPFVWATGPVDVAAMDAAARHLEGTHDFSTFRNVGTEVETCVRTLRSISRSPHGPLPGADTPDYARVGIPLQLTWYFEADGFLKQMVRNLMGTLVACGTGKLSPDAVPSLLAACDRAQAPATAPAQGLSLARVLY